MHQAKRKSLINHSTHRVGLRPKQRQLYSFEGWGAIRGYENFALPRCATPAVAPHVALRALSRCLSAVVSLFTIHIHSSTQFSVSVARRTGPAHGAARRSSTFHVFARAFPNVPHVCHLYATYIPPARTASARATASISSALVTPSTQHPTPTRPASPPARSTQH